MAGRHQVAWAHGSKAWIDAPALASAVFHATGRRLRSSPIMLEPLR